MSHAGRRTCSMFVLFSVLIVFRRIVSKVWYAAKVCKEITPNYTQIAVLKKIITVSGVR
jgi:hypothetical protein